MSDLEEAVERAYRTMVGSLPYSSVSVTALCASAGISRKMFYKRFKGKNDVLRRVFDRDVVKPQVELCRLLSFEKMSAFAPKMERHVFEAVQNDGAFYRSVVLCPQGGEDAFAQVAVSAFEEFNRIMLGEFGYQGDAAEAEYVAAFFAEAKTRMLAKWVREGFPLTAGEAAALYARMALPFWRGII